MRLTDTKSTSTDYKHAGCLFDFLLRALQEFHAFRLRSIVLHRPKIDRSPQVDGLRSMRSQCIDEVIKRELWLRDARIWDRLGQRQRMGIYARHRSLQEEMTSVLVLRWLYTPLAPLPKEALVGND